MNTFVPHYTRPVARDSRPQWEPRPYSENQAKYIKDLMQAKGITAETLLGVFPSRPATFDDGGKVINWLKAQEKTGEATPSPAPSPQGKLPVRLDKNGKHMPQYYAVEMDGKPHFFRVKPGRKEGFYFVDEQASEDLYPVRGDRQKRVLDLIMADPAAAQAMYGAAIGRCARCHRVLTDHSNPYFSMGLGPECGDK